MRVISNSIVVFALLAAIGQSCTLPTAPSRDLAADANQAQRKRLFARLGVTDLREGVQIRFPAPVTEFGFYVSTRVCAGRSGRIRCGWLSAGEREVTIPLRAVTPTDPVTHVWIGDECCSDDQAAWRRGV